MYDTWFCNFAEEIFFTDTFSESIIMFANRLFDRNLVSPVFNPANYASMRSVQTTQALAVGASFSASVNPACLTQPGRAV